MEALQQLGTLVNGKKTTDWNVRGVATEGYHPHSHPRGGADGPEVQFSHAIGHVDLSDPLRLQEVVVHFS